MTTLFITVPVTYQVDIAKTEFGNGKFEYRASIHTQGIYGEWKKTEKAALASLKSQFKQPK